MRGYANRSRLSRRASIACLVAFALPFSAPGHPLVMGSLAMGPFAMGADLPLPGGNPQPSPAPAALVRIRLPLRGGDAVLKSLIGQARDRLLETARKERDPRRPVLVLELLTAPHEPADGQGTDFERAFSLADLVSSREMSGVKTVAWIPQSLRGHGVLLAAACEEIVMPEDASLGEAGVDEPAGRAMRRAVVEAYREIAEARRTLPAAVAIAMVDASVGLLKVESEGGEHFVLTDAMDAFRAEHEVLGEEVLSSAGSLARFTGSEGRRYGFVKYLAADKTALANALAISVSSLNEDDSLAASWRPAIVDVQGPLTRRTVSEVTSLLGGEISANNVNWVALRIDSTGGDLTASIELANFLAQLDANAVRTVAYVAVEARGGAALAALACDQLIMHPNAEIGIGPLDVAMNQENLENDRGPGREPGARRRENAGGAPPEGASDAERLAAVRSIRESLAPRLDRNWSLLAATIEQGVELFEFRHRESGAKQLMSADAAAELPDADNWVRGEPIVGANEHFKMIGTDAAAKGVANQTVESFEQLPRIYAIESEPRLLRPNWALRLVSALASPGLSGFLLVLGLAGLYIEAKTPGVGLGGIVATLAFVLFFWSKYLDQTASWLEVLLFVTGLVFLLIEVVALPGFGVFGLIGMLLMVFSLVLASQTFVIPHTDAEIGVLTRSVGQVAGALVALVFVAVAARRLLPHAPVFRGMVLQPAAAEEKILLQSREMLADFSHLVGMDGSAATDLLPSGKAEIGGELVDVLAEGDPIDRGTKIEVVAAKANRVVVRRKK